MSKMQHVQYITKRQFKALKVGHQWNRHLYVKSTNDEVIELAQRYQNGNYHKVSELLIFLDGNVAEVVTHY